MAIFIFLKEQEKDETYIPITGKTFLGRDSECEIQRSSLSISRVHGEFNISTNEDRLFYQDLGSRNGTFKNKILLDPNVMTEVVEGDILQIGDISIRLAGRSVGEVGFFVFEDAEAFTSEEKTELLYFDLKDVSDNSDED